MYFTTNNYVTFYSEEAMRGEAIGQATASGMVQVAARTPDGTYRSTTSGYQNHTLVVSGDTTVLIDDKLNRYVFDETGRLVLIENKHGEAVELTLF